MVINQSIMGAPIYMKRQGMLVGKFEFNSYGRIMWMFPKLHYTPNNTATVNTRF